MSAQKFTWPWNLSWSWYQERLLRALPRRLAFACVVLAFYRGEKFGWRVLRLSGLREAAPGGNAPALSTHWLIKHFPRQVAFVSFRLDEQRDLINPPVPPESKNVDAYALEHLAIDLYSIGCFHRTREALACLARLRPLGSLQAFTLGMLYLMENNKRLAWPWLRQAAQSDLHFAHPYLNTDEPAKVAASLTPQDLAFGANRLFYHAYNYMGQQTLNVGNGEFRPLLHAKAMDLQPILRRRVLPPAPPLAQFLADRKISLERLRVLPWQWVSQIGHLGMLDVQMRMRELGWWDGDAVLLAPPSRISNDVYLSLLEKHWPLHVVREEMDSDLSASLLALLPSHGLDYYCWRLPSGEVIPWHEAGALALREWQKRGFHHKLRETYDITLGADASVLRANQAAFESWGIKPADWYVCLHFRESSFYGQDREQAGKGLSNRNADPENYAAALQHIIAQGGWVIKMGAQNSPPLPAMARVVDYARSPFKSPALDIHLIRHAKYFIGTTSGLLNVAISFDLPAAVVNALTTESQLWHSTVRFTPKRIRTADGRDLTWRELTSTPGRWGLFTVETMKRAKFASIENSPDEILGAIVEAEALANRQTAALSSADEALLARWHKSVNPPHNYGGALPSVQFLRKYPELLER